ncbi:MBL fold metallo-hydrolase [Pseudoalteromonas piratica]|uniref:Zn-dependent hydrolase n=1 Tax=Pseudoalteromonas piratica TaxID=1348114 RepID=A0A0A7EK73_9GAMM|nr:MBL fold metallo-hydrolase [Pseudoalteromonas piratica]AIY66953.1 Zn-dependent hydrolase [Pseudoalteromonas piratica]
MRNLILFVFITLLCLISGCATNQVNRIKADNLNSAPQKDERFTNRYPGTKTYPYSCEDNCYPPTNEIRCESDMENCQFVGINPSVTEQTGFVINWLGHASFEIETPSGQRFLIDPVFTQFDWPVNLAFKLTHDFERKTPNYTLDKPKPVSAVMYSHLHYDHFNKHDVTQIGNKTRYLVPMGFASHFSQNHYKITEMDWFTSTSVEQTTVHFVPAHHFNSRIWVPFLYDDTNETLWGGWLVEEGGKTLFFAGDTGYSQHFKDIYTRFGEIDICLIPIASYFHEQHETWYRYVHTRPEDAIAAANDLKCKVTIPWGYGNASWQMGDHSSHSPLFRLLKMLKTLKTDSQFIILNEGDTISL